MSRSGTPLPLTASNGPAPNAQAPTPLPNGYSRNLSSAVRGLRTAPQYLKVINAANIFASLEHRATLY